MTGYNLFLDDTRNPEHCATYMHKWIGQRNPELYLHTEWVVVRSYHEFVQYISEHGLPQMVSFDHDLGKEHIDYYMENLEGKPWEEKQLHDYDYDSFTEKTGVSAAKWLATCCILEKRPLPECVIHSANPVGRLNIQSVLDTARKIGY